MNTENKFYSTYVTEENKHEYDLLNLGSKVCRGFGNVYLDDSSNIQLESFSSHTTQEDYDIEFFKLLIEIKPAYKILDILTYHFDFFKQEVLGQEDLFIKHVQYVILPMLKRINKPECVELTLKWIIKNNNMILQQLLQEKNEFLSKAYETALEESKSNPFSVNLNPIDFGDSIGFDKATTKRIVIELVHDGFVTTTLGMKSLFVTQSGLDYLRANKGPTPSAININVGNNSNFQYQSASQNSQQNIKIEHGNYQEVHILVKEIRESLDEIKKHISSEAFENLQSETDYLENNLQRKYPKITVINLVIDNIFTILNAVPANVLANLITANISIP